MQPQEAKTAYQRGDWIEAERMCRSILQEQPDNFDALNVLGIISAQSQRPLEAVELLSRAASVNPNNATVHSNLGNVLHNLKRHEEALESCDRALMIKPDEAFTLNIRGAVLRALNRPEDALDSFLRGLKMTPDDAEALYNCSGLFGALKRYDKALEYCDRALTIKPDYAEALNNRGNALGQLNQPLAALNCFDQALRIKPDYAEAMSNRGIVLMDLRRFEEALASYNHSIRLSPDHAGTHINLFICLMQLGDFARGWEEYEWRWQLAKNRDSRMTLSAPAWEGQKVHGSLLVWNEQGLGDEIFYAGMLNEIKPYAASITVCVDHRLAPLFQRSFGNMRVISRQMLAPDAHFDAHLPMGNLGRYLRRGFNAFPETVRPYLYACADRARYLRAQIARENRLICGLSWISKNSAIGTDKSLRLQDLEPVLTLPGIDFVDLQYGDTTQEQAALYAATRLSLKRVAEIDNFNDIDGLAALIQACDVIVTVSNTTAHLAAALGKPVLLMLPFSQGLLWYWHTDRTDNPWYPTVKPFRQHTAGDWHGVINDISEVLARQRTALCNATSIEKSSSTNPLPRLQPDPIRRHSADVQNTTATRTPTRTKKLLLYGGAIGILALLIFSQL